jgi:hypothetical protein
MYIARAALPPPFWRRRSKHRLKMSRGRVGARRQMPKLSHCVERRNLFTWVVSNGMKFSAGQITPRCTKLYGRSGRETRENKPTRNWSACATTFQIRARGGWVGANLLSWKQIERLATYQVSRCNWENGCARACYSSLPHSSQCQQFILLGVFSIPSTFCSALSK